MRIACWHGNQNYSSILCLQANELQEWEDLFRGGKPSGQRRLVAVLDKLSSEYRLLDTLQFPGSGRLVKVFERTAR